ncbi:MAG: energy-coupling factor ABC transporter permease [Holophagales bacterium]|jgi:cobalt/nickel transport system permease protein|nr:energy-coupling factor ABC transporter permease [Holophagales bacterium]
MADALISPVVGGVMTAVSIGTVGYSVKKVSGDKLDEKKIPMMGVMGAFVFAAQMINFTIPGTGSSGHIGGGILLAALLGPFPALLTLVSVLLIQCLFFADGGLLAYGCNVFNMGVIVCLLACQFIYKPILKKGVNKKNIIIASVTSVVIGLQAGAFCVVTETHVSGVIELPFSLFVALMQPIHLAIGLVEGLVTATILCFVHSTRPEILESTIQNEKIATSVPMKKVLMVFLISAVLVGGVLSLFVSSFHDGLEWSMEKTAGTAKLERGGMVYDAMEKIVDSTAFMPDYALAGDKESPSLGTATAGILGSVITIILAGGVGFAIRAARKKSHAVHSKPSNNIL